ncbi:hypothetical protein YC2023_017970 [Brassica napus]|uniref:(rape) hypothetical protein n=1 Tax=Brassica napus TaxID=3708 RepID=A0A816KAL2_BRANA|nr:unnamed protein product [Brassica napus]
MRWRLLWTEVQWDKKTWRSRDAAIDKIKGTTQSSYQQQPGYLQRLVAAKPGTITKLYTETIYVCGFRGVYKRLSAFVENHNQLVFVSDRHRYIYKGISKRNIRSNFSVRHLEYLVAKAARTFRMEKFYNIFNEIKNMDPACAKYLLN